MPNDTRISAPQDSVFRVVREELAKKDAEIERLKTQLANRQAELTTYQRENERLRAHIAILTEEGHAEIERLRTQQQEACAHCGHDAVLHAFDGKGVTAEPYCEADECSCPKYQTEVERLRAVLEELLSDHPAECACPYCSVAFAGDKAS